MRLILQCALAAALALSASVSVAQTTTGTTTENTELSDDEKALDKALLGVWSRVFLGENNDVTEAALRAAIQTCVTAARLTNLQFQKDAEKTAPGERVARGSVIYWRTKAGIQRLDIKAREVFVFANYEKRTLTSGSSIHILKGKGVGVALKFGRPAKAQLMLENEKVLLKCPPLPAPKTD